MDLCGEVVKHQLFGAGKIVDLIDNYVTVQFDDSNLTKKFSYPSAIGTFLELDNDSYMSQIAHIKTELENKKAVDKRIGDELAKFSNPTKCNFSGTKRPKKQLY